MKFLANISLIFVLACSCSGNKEHNDALAAHNTVEKVKEEWSKVEKPLSITIIDREKEELEAIGTIGVFLSSDPNETAIECSFNGERFKPHSPVNVDSTIVPVVFYPYRPGLHPTDSIKMDSEIGTSLIGTFESTEQTTDNINVRMKLKDITALLRLKIKSDCITDILEGVEINCERGIAASHLHPFDGKWIETRTTRSIRTILTDCMVNNGSPHDFHMIPTEESGEITIGVKINGKDLNVSTTIPPMRAGSITELRLVIANGKLNIGSSWVDTKHPFEKMTSEINDSIMPLQYIRKDGTISKIFDDKCLAVIIETDGKHGKAVAVADTPIGMMFKGKEFSTNRIFQTVDGQYREGCYNTEITQEISGENRVAFNPNVRYSGQCAFGHRNGGLLTSNIIANCSLDVLEAFTVQAELGTAYIPTVYELAWLSFFLAKNKDSLPSEFEVPVGFYTTCCESGIDTYYSVDINNYKVSAHNSKLYPNTNLRLFYLF